MPLVLQTKPSHPVIHQTISLFWHPKIPSLTKSLDPVVSLSLNAGLYQKGKKKAHNKTHSPNAT